MASIFALKASQIFKEKDIKFLTKTDLVRLFNINSPNTAYKLLQRLEKKQIIQRVIKGIYLVTANQVTDFEIANAIYQPSYLSLETVLNYYGILPQFPFSITSITLKKSKSFVFRKQFEYAHIANKFYWGFVKDKNFLIATPEKALLDTLYLVLKGMRNLSFGELDFSSLNHSLLKTYCKKMNQSFLTKYLREKQIL